MSEEQVNLYEPEQTETVVSTNPGVAENNPANTQKTDDLRVGALTVENERLKEELAKVRQSEVMAPKETPKTDVESKRNPKYTPDEVDRIAGLEDKLNENSKELALFMMSQRDGLDSEQVSAIRSVMNEKGLSADDAATFVRGIAQANSAVPSPDNPSDPTPQEEKKEDVFDPNMSDEDLKKLAMEQVSSIINEG